MCFVGLDVGGTYVKGARLAAGRIAGPVVRRPVPPFLNVSGVAREIDPDALLEVARAVLRDVIGDARPSGIFVTGQMGGYVCTNDHGEACSPIVSWQDCRVSSTDAVAAQIGPDAVVALGDGLRLGQPVVNLSREGVPRGQFLQSLLSFVCGRLSGQRARIVHATDAASWGMLHTSRSEWLKPTVRLVGVDVRHLPRVSRDLEVVGMSIEWDVPVWTAVGDQQASLLGVSLGSNELSVNLATGCQVSVVSPSTQSPAQLRPYFGEAYLHTVTHLPAGRLLTEVLRQVRGGVSAEDWGWALLNWQQDPRLESAVRAIAQGILTAARLLSATALPIAFSGGIAQRFEPVRSLICEEWGRAARVFSGDDAALSGLAALAGQVAT